MYFCFHYAKFNENGKDNCADEKLKNITGQIRQIHGENFNYR